jgi:hypothetical protein
VYEHSSISSCVDLFQFSWVYTKVIYLLYVKLPSFLGFGFGGFFGGNGV